MGFEMVLSTSTAAVIGHCSRHGFDGQQHPATVSEVLGCGDPTTGRAEKRRASETDYNRRLVRR